MTNLTKLCDKGKPPEGDYYIKKRNGYLPYDNIDSNGIWRNSIDEDIVEVLAPVPSYEEWKAKLEENTQLKKWCEEFNALNVSEENQRLKELLKKCRYELEGEFGIGAANLVEEIDEVLK